MVFRDIVNSMYGRLEIYKVFPDGKKEKVFEDYNAITYRGKTIMARILAGGSFIPPNSTPLDADGKTRHYQYGSSANQMRVTGMAFGNGGHLIHNVDKTTVSLGKDTNNVTVPNLVVNNAATTANTAKPAMPFISGSDWGYDATADRTIPGTTYEPVENGNIPWDGTANIYDNNLGVTQPNTTLYSETFRIPMDAADGYSFPTSTEVQYKATLGQTFLNYSSRWGFSSQPANIVSEAGLIVGYRPDTANLLTGQVYSNNGSEPGAGTGFDFGSGQTNFGSAATAALGSKESGLFGANDTVPIPVVNGVDVASVVNTWNLISRKTFPGIPKSSAFALLFVYTVGF